MCVPLGIALASVLAGHYHGQAVFLAKSVTGAPDVSIAPPVGNILPLVHHVHSTENDVVVDVPLVNVRGQYIGIFSLQDFICKLSTNLVGLSLIHICEAGNVNENCPLCEKSLRSCTAPEAVKTDTETPQEKPKSNMGSLMILLVLALAGGGAALYYFKFRKPKADTTGHDDLDEYDFGEDEDADEEPAEIEIHSEDGQEDET